MRQRRVRGWLQLAEWYKRKPRQKQWEALKKAGGKPFAAFFMEMGTGKTKIAIDELNILFPRGEVEAALIITLNGLQQNWILEELPKDINVKYKGAYRRAGWSAAERDRWIDVGTSDRRYLKVFAMNVEQLTTDMGFASAERILTMWKTYLFVDESHVIKNGAAQCTKALYLLGQKAKYKRIASGTAAPESPMDLFSQFWFLNPGIIGHRIFSTFRAEYAQIKLNLKPEVIRKMKTNPGYRPTQWDKYPQVLRYKNIDKLKARIEPYTFYCRLDDCEDLPPYIFSAPVRVELTDEQRRIYDELKNLTAASITAAPQGLSADDKLLWLVNNADMVPANQLVKYLRLQQICGGFATADDGTVTEIPSNRIKILKDLLETIDGPVLIFSVFRAELAQLQSILGEDLAVSYHGGVKADQRQKNLARWRSGEAKYWIAHPRSGGIGLTLTESHTVVHYSLSPRALLYMQANGRARRIGQTKAVNVVRFAAVGTLEAAGIRAVQKKAAEMNKLLYGVTT